MYSGNITDTDLQRHRRILAGFMVKGSSLAAWCRENAVKDQNAHRALRGQWKGPKASALVVQIMQASGVEQ